MILRAVRNEGGRPARGGLFYARWGVGAALLLAVVTAACAQPAELLPTAPPGPVAVTSDTVGPPGSARTGQLHLPAGPGPHPAVVLLHGCSGVTPTVRSWAAWLAARGHVALVLDSFGPRGVRTVCTPAGNTPGPSPVPPRLRAEDAFAAAAYLRGRPDVDPDRVSAVGFSHGGSTALVTASRTAVDRLGGRPFARVIAFYPFCPRNGAPLASPVLTLIGDADDWTPAERCVALHAAWRPEFGVAALHVYPGATHAFDSRGPERRYLGYLMRHDAAATADAGERMLRFLTAP